MYGFEDRTQLAKIEEIAPVVAVAQVGSMKDVIETNEELVASLGADTGDGSQAAQDRARTDPRVFGEDISGQCRAEAHRNLYIAVALAIGGAVLVSTAIVLAGRRRRRHEVIRAEQTDAPSG